MRAKNSDACVVVYSIADRSSFRAAQEVLLALHSNWLIQPQQQQQHQQQHQQQQLPVLLLGNKKDLEHLRQVG